MGSATPRYLFSLVSPAVRKGRKPTVHGLWAGSLGRWLISFSWDHLCNPATGMQGMALIWGTWVSHRVCNKNIVHVVYDRILWSWSAGIYQVIVLTTEAQWAIWKPSSIAPAGLQESLKPGESYPSWQHLIWTAKVQITSVMLQW